MFAASGPPCYSRNMTQLNPIWQRQITKTEVLIDAYSTAIEAIVGGGSQSYTLDTGQSRQTVTKLDLDKLDSALDALYNRLATLEARVHGCGVMVAGPRY